MLVRNIRDISGGQSMNTWELSRIAFAATCCLAATPLRAETGVVDQVEALDIEAGENELELQLIAFPRQDGDPSYVGGGLTFERGLSDAFALGIEIEFEREGGRFKVDEVTAQAKLVVADPDEGGLGLGIQLAAGYAFEDRKFAMETVLIAALERESWTAAANLIGSAREGRLDAYDLRYAARIDRPLSGGFSIGLEAGGEITSQDPRGHWIGPVIALESAEGGAMPTIELGAFAGLNRAAPDVQFRLEIDFAF